MAKSDLILATLFLGLAIFSFVMSFVKMDLVWIVTTICISYVGRKHLKECE